MTFTKEDLAGLTTAAIGSGAFSAEQVKALEEGCLELLNDNDFLHKLLHALSSVQHNH